MYNNINTRVFTPYSTMIKTREVIRVLLPIHSYISETSYIITLLIRLIDVLVLVSKPTVCGQDRLRGRPCYVIVYIQGVCACDK